jgi:hypothetical protein
LPIKNFPWLKINFHFMLAKSRNPLKQGISSNLNTSNKSHKKREFTPKQETKAKNKQRSIQKSIRE